MKVNPEKYRRAQEVIARGTWRVEPDAGLIFGKYGRAIGSVSDPGYLSAGFYLPSGGRQAVYLHRVIWEYVNGELAEGLVTNHKNGVKTDNRIANLEAVTPRQNTQHAFRTGLSVTVGERCHLAVLSSRDAVQIYEMAWGGVPRKQIAAQFGVATNAVWRIQYGQTWVRETGHDSAARPGPGNGSCLSSAQAQEIYRLAWNDPRNNTEVGAMFGVTQATVSDIKHGRTWARVTGHLAGMP